MEIAWNGLFSGVQSHPFQDPLWNPENKEKIGENEKILFEDIWQNLVTNRI